MLGRCTSCHYSNIKYNTIELELSILNKLLLFHRAMILGMVRRYITFLAKIKDKEVVKRVV